VVKTGIYHSKRFAFTMIELIFAIVIISIVVISLPVATSVTQNSTSSSLVQEAIFASSTELMDATVGYWDENSMQDISMSQFSRVINIIGDCNATTKLRPGHIAQSLHRRCLDTLTTTPRDASGGSVYDLDDVAHGWQNVFIGGTKGQYGYKQTYQSRLVVTRNQEIKTITSTIRDENNNVVVSLKLESANIGEVDYYKRIF